MMKYCMQCGQQNEDDSLYCIGCGNPLEPPVEQVSPAFAEAQAQMQADSYSSVLTEAEYMTTMSGQDASEPNAFASPVASEPQPTVDIYAASKREAEASRAKEAQDAANALNDEAFQPQKSGTGPAHADGAAFDAQGSAEALEAIEDLDERLATVESLIKDRASALQEALDALSQQFDGKISRNEHEAAILKSMSDEMQEYRDDLYAKLTLPLIRDIVDAREALGMALTRSQDASAAGNDGLASDIQLCRDMLADSLARNQVQVITSMPGDDFESFKHKIVGKVPTNDSAQHGKIAEVSGQSYKLGDTYIAPAMVKVFSIDEAGR